MKMKMNLDCFTGLELLRETTAEIVRRAGEESDIETDLSVRQPAFI